MPAGPALEETNYPTVIYQHQIAPELRGLPPVGCLGLTAFPRAAVPLHLPLYSALYTALNTALNTANYPIQWAFVHTRIFQLYWQNK